VTPAKVVVPSFPRKGASSLSAWRRWTTPAVRPALRDGCVEPLMMGWTYGPSTCSECGVTKGNPAALRRHTLVRHRHLGRNANRRLPPQQKGPDPLLGAAGAPVAAPAVDLDTPLPPPPVLTATIHGEPATGTDTAGAVGLCHVTPETTGLYDTNADALLLQLADLAAEKASQTDPDAPSGAAKPPPSGRAAKEPGGVAHVFSSVSTEARAEYERIGDIKRCSPAVEARPHCKPGKFNTPALRLVQEFVHDANGSGLSTAFQTKLYNLIAAWDGSAADGMQPPAVPNKIKNHFSSANAFRNAVRDDLDDAVLSAGWRKCTMLQGGVRYVSFFRSGLQVALDALRCANKVQLRRDDVAVGDRRESPIDGEAFKAHQDAVDSVTAERAFVLGAYVYSDASLLSWSGGKLVCSLPCVLVTGPDAPWYSVPP